MPLTAAVPTATEADGSVNPDYCGWCYHDGAYTSESTMAEMIDFCVPKVVEAVPGMTEDIARAKMNEIFPTLKRWQ
jgi:hypothetical protein